MQFLRKGVSYFLTMERTRGPRTNVRVSRLVLLPQIPQGIEVVVIPEISRCPVFGPPPLEVPRVVVLDDVEDDMPPMEDEDEPVVPRTVPFGRAGRLLQAMRRYEAQRPGRRSTQRAAPRTPVREDSLQGAGVSGGTVPSGTPPPGYTERDPMQELGQLVQNWEPSGTGTKGKLFN